MMAEIQANEETSSFFSASSGHGTMDDLDLINSSSHNNAYQNAPPPASSNQRQPETVQNRQLAPIFPISPSPNYKTETSLLLEQALFSSYTTNGSVLLEGDDDSLPSLSFGVQQSLSPNVPPSPISRPSQSLMEEAPGSSASWKQDDNERPLQSQQKEKFVDKKAAKGLRSTVEQPPPVHEVLLDQAEEDTFFEDRSLEHRAQRSLITSPNRKSETEPQSSAIKLTPSRPNQSSQEEMPDKDASYSSEKSSSYRANSLQTLIRMKEELVRANEKLKTMEKGKKILTGERDEISRKLKQQEERASAQVMELKVELSRLQGVSETIKSQRDDWSQEKKRYEEQIRAASKEKKELMHKRLANENRQRDLKLQLERLQAQVDSEISEKNHLVEVNDRLREENTNLEKVKLDLEEKLSTLNKQETQTESLKARADEEKRDWLREKQAMEKELEQLHETLALSKQQLEEKEKSNEIEKAKWEASLRNAEEKVELVTKSSQEEIEKLQKELQESNETIQHIRASRSSLRSPGRATTSIYTSNNFNNVRFQYEEGSTVAATTSPVHQNDETRGNRLLDPSSELTERLARIRDSSDRASLIRAHNHEISRLREEKESIVKSMESNHADAMRRARKHSDLKLETRLNELKTSLQQEYDEKLEELESNHRQQLSKLKDEANRAKEIANDSLRSATSKLAEMLQKHEGEVSRRLALEKSTRQLNMQFDIERKRLATRHEVELKKRRADWEEERNTLLTILQQEFNQVVERRRSGKQPPEPRPAPQTKKTLLVVDTSKNDDEAESALSQQRVDSTRSGSTAPLTSPSFSDLDSAIRETEVLVDGLF